MDLYTALKEIDIGAIRTIKAGSVSKELLALNNPSDKIKTQGLTEMMSLKRKIKPLGLDDIYKRGPRKGQIRDRINFKKNIRRRFRLNTLYSLIRSESYIINYNYILNCGGLKYI